MRACYAVGQLSGRVLVAKDLKARHQRQRRALEHRFSNLDTAHVYQVEMFPYCDQLAKDIRSFPRLHRLGSLRKAYRTLLSPATTMHYFPGREHPSDYAPVYEPATLTLLLILLKPLDWLIKALRLAGLLRN